MSTCPESPTLIADKLLNTNQAPTAQKRQLVKALLEDSTAAAAVLEAKIGALQAELAQESAKLAKIQKVVAGYRAIISPFRHLPTEILQTIFRFTLPRSHNALASTKDPPLLFTRVCREWRDVALATPELWASIHIVCMSFEDDMPDEARAAIKYRASAIAAWIARSGACLLDISIQGARSLEGGLGYGSHVDLNMISSVPLTLSAILPYSHRWRELHITASIDDLGPLEALCTPDLPELVSFSLNENMALRGGPVTHDDLAGPTFLSKATRLRDLRMTLSTRPNNLARSLPVIPHDSLVSLCLRDPYIDARSLRGLADNIAQCVTLQQLKVDIANSRIRLDGAALAFQGKLFTAQN
ncbi:hypothetical protein BD626DRAFT_568253 [Schizophyllum amplum]|uniref:F-box domain-containing protein n=1 Tax=Schizophyllum amplum TaxID=97359 RepID=A0A550CI76_9AGAR|nr:hypothetical protein BD626DRAFT_568253 [Auriculariopsis ampla]